MWRHLFLSIGLLAGIGLSAHMLLAQDVSTPTETPTFTTTPTWTATPSWTPTPTFTSTPTWTPTWTPVVVIVPATQLVPMVVTQIVIATSVPVIPAAPVIPTSLPPAAPSQSATRNAPYASQLYGWRRHESIEFVQVLGIWVLRTSQNASDGAYHNTDDSGAIMRFPFDGDGVRIGFRLQRGGGSFQVKIDNEIVGLYDTNLGSESSQANAYSVVSEPYFLSRGYHVIDLITNGMPVALDYLEVFISPDEARGNSDIAAGSNTLIDVPAFELVYEPPTLQPTPQPPTDQVILVDVVVAYDSNGNKTVDPNEGVRNVSVRAVDPVSNTLLASAITDEAGFGRIRVISAHDILIAIPLLGETSLVRIRRAAQSPTAWTVLLPPANVPGMIP